MNTEIFKGHWNDFKGKVKEKWGKLTDNDLTEINGKREQLLGKLQKAYGYEKEKAEEELNDFEERLGLEDENEEFEEEEIIDERDRF